MGVIDDPNREAAIAQAVMFALEDAAESGEAQHITICQGKPCPGDDDGCIMCEHVVVLPNGQVERETRRN